MNEVLYKRHPVFTNYEIGTDGSVWSLKFKGISRRMKLKGKINSFGYIAVVLYNGVNKKHSLVHRLVAELFILNLQNKAQVNHKNGIKDDNRLENLEWNTQSENMSHAVKYLGMNISLRCRQLSSKKNRGEGNPSSKMRVEDILKIRDLRKNGLSFGKIGNQYSVAPSTIERIINKKTWQHI